MSDLYSDPNKIDLSDKKLSIEAIIEAANEVVKHYGEPKIRLVGEPDPELIAEWIFKQDLL